MKQKWANRNSEREREIWFSIVLHQNETSNLHAKRNDTKRKISKISLYLFKKFKDFWALEICWYAIDRRIQGEGASVNWRLLYRIIRHKQNIWNCQPWHNPRPITKNYKRNNYRSISKQFEPITKNCKRNNVQANRKTITGQSLSFTLLTKNSEGQCVPCSCIIYGVAYSEVWAAAVFDTK